MQKMAFKPQKKGMRIGPKRRLRFAVQSSANLYNDDKLQKLIIFPFAFFRKISKTYVVN